MNAADLRRVNSCHRCRIAGRTLLPNDPEDWKNLCLQLHGRHEAAIRDQEPSTGGPPGNETV